jgi:hypothetical protein
MPRKKAASTPASRPEDIYRFSMTTSEVAAAARGVVPPRIRRACFVAVALLVDGDHDEHLRRQRAERAGTLDALMVRELRGRVQERMKAKRR